MSPLNLFGKLKALHPTLFEMLLQELNPPPGFIPSNSAAQGDRTSALFSWAKGPGGPGLEQVEAVLNEVLAKEVPKDSALWFGSVPQPPISFRGRSADLAILKQRLNLSLPGSPASKPSRTVLGGWLGVGKTSVAATLVNDPDVQAAFEGILWVSLGPEPNIEFELRMWTHLLGLNSIGQAHSKQEAKAILRNFLNSKRFLLVLDDIWDIQEGLWFDVGGRLCSTLFTTSDNEVAGQLATIPGNIYKLPPLNEEDALSLMKEIAPRVSKNKGSECLELVRDLGCLPLAIRVASGLLEEQADLVRGVDKLIAEIREGKKLLEAAPPAEMVELATHTDYTLAALLQKSIEPLLGEYQTHLCDLGAFAPQPASLSDTALSFVWQVSIDETVEVIRILVRRGLLEPAANGLNRRLGAGRFRLHVLLAMMARRLSASNQQPYRRHGEYFESLAKEAEDGVKGHLQTSWLARLDEEDAQFRSALKWARDQNEIQLALRLGSALFRFWHLRGLSKEGRDYLTSILEMPAAKEYPQERANALKALGSLAGTMADYQAAESVLRECRQIQEILNDTRIGDTLNNLGVILQAQMKYEEAEQVYQESIRKLGGNSPRRSAPLGNLARNALLMGDLEAAQRFNRMSLVIRASERNQRGMADCRQIQGDICYQNGDTRTCILNYVKSLRLFLKVQNKLGIAQTLERIACLDMKDDEGLAAILFGAAQRTREEIGSPLPPSERNLFECWTYNDYDNILRKQRHKEWDLGRAMAPEEAALFVLQICNSQQAY